MEKRTGNYYEEVEKGGYMQVKRITWGALFAGAIVMIVAMMLLNLLGIGIGMGSINPTTETNPFQGLGTGTLIWWIVSNIIAIFAGGYVAGRVAGVPHKQSAVIHGIVSWCLYTLFSFWLYTTAIGAVVSGVGSAVSGTFSGLKNVVSSIGSAGQSGTFQDMNLDQVEQEVNTALEQLNVRDTVQQLGQDARITKGQLTAIVRKVFVQDGQLTTQVSRDEIINAITSETTISREQAEEVASVIQRQVENVKQQWETVKQDAVKTGEDVASAVSSAAIWTFVALLVGLITAAIGGIAGKPSHFLHEELYHARGTTTDR